MPELVDLCDPESLLIARETDVTALEAQRARDSRPTPRKLTPEDVTFIRASNLRGTVLARRFKVSDNTISKIRSGKTHNASYRTTREERKEAHGH
jgi:DNA-binding transcriptional regulator YiaG